MSRLAARCSQSVSDFDSNFEVPRSSNLFDDAQALHQRFHPVRRGGGGGGGGSSGSSGSTGRYLQK